MTARQWLSSLDTAALEAAVAETEAADAADRALEGGGEIGAAAIEQGSRREPSLLIEAHQLRELVGQTDSRRPLFGLYNHELDAAGVLWEVGGRQLLQHPCRCGEAIDAGGNIAPICRRVREFDACGVRFRLACEDASDLAAFLSGILDAAGESIGVDASRELARLAGASGMSWTAASRWAIAAAIAACFDAADVQAVAVAS